MARKTNNNRPQNIWLTLRNLLSYMGRHKFLLLIVAVLVTASALANLFGTYMIRPVVNRLATGEIKALIAGVVITAAIFGLVFCPLTAIRRPWSKWHKKFCMISGEIYLPICKSCLCAFLILIATETL